MCRDRLLAAECDVREMVMRLRAPLPVAARGVAAASVLLTDATGPLWNQRNHTPLREALHAAIAQLDPAVPLFSLAVHSITKRGPGAGFCHLD